MELEDAGGVNKDVSLAEWLMIYYFKVKLKSAFALGMYKTYKSFNDDLNKVRGQIDINNYFKKSYFDGKIRCNYYEHCYSNEINYVISLALNKIFKNKKYLNLVKDLHTIKNAFNQVVYKKENIKFLKKCRVKNPFYANYNELFGLANRIIDDEFGSTGEDSFSAFLFDISLLFEHHIRALLKSRYNLAVKNKRDYSVPNGCGYNDLYPDIIIYNDDGTISIYDVKYKRFKDEVDRGDRFQLISYVATYLNDYEIKECGFIYPADMKKDCIKEQSLKIAKIEIPFKIFFYDIAKKSDYKKFKKKQKELDEEFLDKFNISNQTQS